MWYTSCLGKPSVAGPGFRLSKSKRALFSALPLTIDMADALRCCFLQTRGPIALHRAFAHHRRRVPCRVCQRRWRGGGSRCLGRTSIVPTSRRSCHASSLIPTAFMWRGRHTGTAHWTAQAPTSHSTRRSLKLKHKIHTHTHSCSSVHQSHRTHPPEEFAPPNPFT